MSSGREKVERILEEEMKPLRPSHARDWAKDITAQLLSLKHPNGEPMIGMLAENRPKIVCLCGSTRFKDAFTKAQLDETLAGNIVLTIGCNMKSDTEIFGHLGQDEFDAIKGRLDQLHFRKIEMADEVLILNVGGYIGESTSNEIAHAKSQGKPIRYLETSGV